MNASHVVDRVNQLKHESDQLIELSNKLYNENFADYFVTMRQAQERLKLHGEKSYTDDELGNLLTEIPLLLFGAAEALSKFKLHLEVAKLQTKQDLKDSKLYEAYATQLAEEVEYDKLIQSIYASVVARVETEISFSKEFIMVLKKFWDARRATENVVPIGAVNPDIPEYKLPNGQTYIK